jgi:hypothetical protein
MNEQILYIGMPAVFLLKLNPNVAKLPEAARKKLLAMLPKESSRSRLAWAAYESANKKFGSKVQPKGKPFDIEKESNTQKRRELLGKLYLLKRELCLCDQYRAARVSFEMKQLLQELKKIPK